MARSETQVPANEFGMSPNFALHFAFEAAVQKAGI